MPGTLNRLNIYLVRIDSNFSKRICGKNKLSSISECKLLKKTSQLARKQFILSRALVNYILESDWSSHKLNLAIDDSLNPPGILLGDKLCLSLSHSGNYVAVAISESIFAIDVENILRNRDYLEMASRAFHSIEIKDLEDAESQKNLEERFYLSWTYRECCYKLGILKYLWDQSFDSKAQIKKSCLTPFSYYNDDIYLSLIATQRNLMNLIRLD